MLRSFNSRTAELKLTLQVVRQLARRYRTETAGLTDLQTSVNGLATLESKQNFRSSRPLLASIVKFAESAKTYAANTGEFAEVRLSHR